MSQEESKWLFERRRRKTFAVFQNQVLTIWRVARSIGLHNSRAVGCVLENVGFTHSRGAVGTGAMRHRGGKYHDAPLAHRNCECVGTGLLAAYVTELRQAMRKRPAQMPARNNPWTTVVNRRVVESDPTGQVRLRLDVGVAIVLMPRERLRVFGLLVHRLIPVKPDVRPDQIVTEVLENAARRKLAQHLGKPDQVHGESDSVGLRNTDPAVRTRSQEFFGLHLERIDRVANAHDGRAIDRIFEHEKPALIERTRLLITDRSK